MEKRIVPLKFMIKKNALVQFFAIAFSLFLLYIIYSANTGRDLVFYKIIKNLPYGDKIGHISLLWMLTFWVNWALQARTFLIRQRQFLLGSTGIFIFFTLEEFSQNWFQNRTFDWVDLLCNYIGIVLGSLVIYWMYERKALKNKAIDS